MSQLKFELDNELFTTQNAYNAFLILGGVIAATATLIMIGEANNRLKYDSRFARVISGLLRLQVNFYHSANQKLHFPENEGNLVAMVPHRTGVEGVMVAAAMSGNKLPRFFASTFLNWVPGVDGLLKLFKTIPIESGIKNDVALKTAEDLLNKHELVGIFSQGNFSRPDQEPPPVYQGTANLALTCKVPVHVLRLDGLWSLTNPTIPLFVRNSVAYRAFFAWFFPNNLKVKQPWVINFHLLEENQQLSEEAKKYEINAQLYAFACHTYDLTNEDLDTIKQKILENKHHPLWDNKLKQIALEKEIKELRKPYTAKTTFEMVQNLFKSSEMPEKVKSKIDTIQSQLDTLKAEAVELRSAMLYMRSELLVAKASGSVFSMIADN